MSEPNKITYWNSFLRMLTGMHATAGIQQALRDLGVVATSFLIARFLAAAANICAARVLGPAEFGNSQLVLTICQLFALPAMMGLNTAVVRYGAATQQPAPVISTCYWTSILGTMGAACICFAATPWLSIVVSVDKNIVIFGLLCGMAFSAMIMAGSAQQALSMFRARGAMEISVSGLFLFVLLLLIWVGERSFTAASGAYLAAFVLTAVAGVIPIRRMLHPSLWSTNTLLPLASFALYNLVCGVAVSFMYSIQRFILNHYFSSTQVGVYGVYSTASINLAVMGGTMIATVLFPKASASPDRQRIWRVFMRAWLWLCPVVFAGFCAGQVVVLKLSGSRYPVDWTLIALFAATSLFIMVYTSLGQIVGAEGDRGARWGMVLSVGMCLMTLALSVFLIRPLGVAGAVLTLTVSYVVGISALIARSRHYL